MKGFRRGDCSRTTGIVADVIFVMRRIWRSQRGTNVV